MDKNEFEFEELKDKGSTLSVHTGDPIAIKEMQKSLNDWGYTDAFGRKLSEDGDFGINTFNSVIKFQQENDLVPDGIVGDKTWKAISDRKKKEEGENYNNFQDTVEEEPALQNDADFSDNVDSPLKHGAFATIDEAIKNSPARTKEIKEDNYIKNERDFESLKEKGSELSVHSGSPYTIKELQKVLNSMGYTDALGRPLSEDGDFGINTFNSVIKFQEDNGLFPDGVVGDKTWKAISDKRKKTSGITAEKVRRKKSYDGANAEISFLPEEKAEIPDQAELYYGNAADLDFDCVLGYAKGKVEEAEEWVKGKAEDAKEWIKDKAEEKIKEAATTMVDTFVGKYGFDEEEVRNFINNPDQRNIINTDYRKEQDFNNTPAKEALMEELTEVREIAIGNGDKVAEYTANYAITDLRNFDDTSITTAYYLNDSDGASGMGHAGVLLVNESGEGVLFSFYPQDQDKLKDSDSEMRISVLGKYETQYFLENKKSYGVSTSGKYISEQYENSSQYSIKPALGKAMFEQAVAITIAENFQYNLLEQNCEHVALSILNIGGVNIAKKHAPNLTFKTEIEK